MIVIFSTKGFINEKPKSQTWENNVKQLLYDQDVKLENGSNFMSLETHTEL